jgi:hypothetical protein
MGFAGVGEVVLGLGWVLVVWGWVSRCLRTFKCQSHFQMSASRPSSNVRFCGVLGFVFHGLQLTQCRRPDHERAGHPRPFHLRLLIDDLICGRPAKAAFAGLD